MNRARSVGAFVPHLFVGDVYSIHGHAINVRARDDYRLISIVDRESDLTALSLFVTRLPGLSEPGPRVTIDNAELQIEGMPDGGFGLVWGHETPRYTGAVSQLSPHSSDAAVRGMVDSVRESLRIHGAHDGLYSIGAGMAPQNPYAARAAEILASPVSSRSRIEPARLGELLAQLVGLGPGFTPSGDDFICGALLAIRMLGRSDSAHPIRDADYIDSGPIRERLATTTIAGATLLALACDGSFPAYLVSFAGDIVAFVEGKVPHMPDPQVHPDAPVAASSLEQTVLAAIAHGATSGTDALSGFLWMTDLLQ